MKKQIANVMVITFLLAGLAGCGSKEPSLTPAPASPASSGTAVSSQPKESESKPAAQSGGELTQENILEYPVTDLSQIDFGTCEGGVLVEGCSSEDEVIVIPEEFNGDKVVGVGHDAFGFLKARAVVLPDTVTFIDRAAFNNCKELEYVHLGSGLKKIGELAFNVCSSLKQVTFPEGMEKFSSYVFVGCTEIGEIVIPASVTELPNGIGHPESCPNMVVVTPEGSAAEAAAIEQKIPVKHP